jgi:hypothetical protein
LKKKEVVNITIKEKKNFVYNNRESEDLGIVNVNIDTGMLEEPFLDNRSINETFIQGRTKPYFMGIKSEPLILRLSFAFLSTWDDELIREIIQIFHVDYYKPLWFEDAEDQIFYCMTTAEPALIHNSLKQGYINLQFRCNDIYTYSRLKRIQYTDFSSDVRFSNRGDVPILPEMVCIKEGNESIDIVITNNTNNSTLILTNIIDGEEIYIDHNNGTIISNTNLYRYNDHNNIFLRMERGSNILSVEGVNLLKFEWQYKTLPG